MTNKQIHKYTNTQIHKYTNTQIQRQQQIRLCRTIRYKQDIKVKEVEIQTYSKQNTQYVYKEIQGMVFQRMSYLTRNPAGID